MSSPAKGNLSCVCGTNVVYSSFESGLFNPLFCYMLVLVLTMKTDVSDIINIIMPVFEANNVYLVDMEFRGGGKDRVLSIFVDTKEGITLSQITHLNREISDLLDMHNIISGPYHLEISSPGLDRPLKYLWQYQKNINRKLQVNYRDKDIAKEITGKLVDADEEGILIETENDKLKILFAEITKSKVKISI